MKNDRQERTGKANKRNTGKNIALKALGLTSVMVFSFSALALGTTYQKYKSAQEDYDFIRSETVIESDKAIMNTQEVFDHYSSDTATSGDPSLDLILEDTATELELTAPVYIDFDSLHAINEDIYGWIYVEALPEISYPILKSTDNDFYLTHDPYKQESISGSLFMDINNKTDFTSMNTLIYGHNMKDQSMFGALKNFLYDQSTYDRSPYIWVITPDKALRYEIISAYTAGINNDAYSLFPDNFKEMANADSQYEDLYRSFLGYLNEYSQIHTSADMNALTTDNRCIVLSTCMGDYDYRNVVAAVLTNP